MELSLAALLVSSLTSVGLLSLWAATSPRHWFLRTAVFVGVLSLLLLIPAYEPVVAFALQGLVVAIGIQIGRWFKRTGPTPSRQFSLATLLQVTVVVSVMAAVGVKLPTLNLMGWQSVVLIGVSGGFVTLIGFLVVRGQGMRWWVRILVGLCLVSALALLLAWSDYFVNSFLGFNGWPPADTGVMGGFAAAFMGQSYETSDAILFWGQVFVVLIVLLNLLIWLAGNLLTVQVQKLRRRYCSCLLLLLTVVMAPGAYVYYQLMTPLPIPNQPLLVENGLDDLSAGGRLAENSQFNAASFDFDTVSDKGLQATIDEMAPAYEKFRSGLSKEVQVLVDYHSFDSFGPIQELRNLSRCLKGRAVLAAREDRFSDALECNLDLMRYGYAVRNKGLMIHALIGVFINVRGQDGLYQLRTKFSTEQSARIIAYLQRLETECEPATAFVHRDRIWEQHATGWHGHLMQLLTDLNPSEVFYGDTAFLKAYKREPAISRLLRVELALIAFHNEQGQLPESLDELVPKYLTAVPLDPFSPTGKPLLYRREGKDYVLYSVGNDGEDDGGVLPKDYEDPRFWYMDLGDFRLEYYFAPDPSVAGNTSPPLR